MGKTNFNFTKRSLEALPTPEEKRVAYHDTQTRGLGMLVQPSGHRAFFWFRKVRGYPTRKAIGEFPDLTVEQARASAARINSDLAEWKRSGYEGQSPFEKKRAAQTLGSVLEDYIERRVVPHAKNPERAAKAARGKFNCYVSRWRDRPLNEISRLDVRTLNAEVGEKHGHYTANRLLSLLRVLYNWALKEELWDGPNPVARITKFREESRTRFVQHDELPKIFRALSEESSRDLRDFVLIALFAGARKADTLGMRWEDLDLDRGLWTIPDPKSRQSYVAILVPEVVTLLRARWESREGESRFVFPSNSKSGHILSLKNSWKKLLVRAGIKDLRVHDLRRTLGSWQAAAGVSLPVIGKGLGHKSLSATEIYARVSLDPVREAVSAATQQMIAAGKIKTAKRKLLKAPRE